MDETKTIYVDTSGALFPKSCKYQIQRYCFYFIIIITVSSKTVDDPPTQHELISVLVPRLSITWHTIGLGLGLSPQQLKEVQDNRPDDRDGCLKDVLMMWEDNATDDKPYTWATMLDVLRYWKVGGKDFSTLLSKNLKKCKLFIAFARYFDQIWLYNVEILYCFRTSWCVVAGVDIHEVLVFHYLSTCVCIIIYICTCVHTHMHAHTHVHSTVYVCMCMHIYMHMCRYVYYMYMYVCI